MSGPGIRDVARLAGVSPATVSRVLGGGSVSEGLRLKVEAAVRETGYRPNLSARRLRSGRSSTIGLIVADIRNPFFTAVSRSIEAVAYEAGLRVILCNTDEDPAKEAIHLRLMREEGVAGVVFAPTLATSRRLGPGRYDFPVVLIDRAGPPGLYDCVVIDNAAAVATLVRHLHDRGYRRIAALFGNASTTGIERRQGYLSAMAALGLDPDAVMIPPRPDAAGAAMARRLAAGPRPDAVIASNALVMMGVVGAVRAAGLRVPQELGLAGIDNEPWTELMGPGLTVFEQPVEAIGAAAMSMLLERLDRPEAPVRTTILSGRLVVRGSTARREGRAAG